jgi:preprotein translocase subunit SecF
VELFHGVNIDWLGKKWYFLAFSLLFSVSGVLSLLFWHHLPLDVDFQGGTQVRVRFDHKPDVESVRAALEKSGLHDSRITTFNSASANSASTNEVIVSLPQRDTKEVTLDAGRAAIVSALGKNYPSNAAEIRSVEIVGPQVGAALRNQALLATGYSLAGMLVYLWFRFELIYGVAAVVAVFHDTLITIGFFSLFNYEISLTVIAAILTLIGYSMNDTIVVFDRIRENLAISRRENLADLVNRSINQTLSRTVLTSGLTFLTVLSLFFFGGEVLHPFSFALVVGILIGTYSSIAVAAPMLVAWQQSRAPKGRAAALPAARRSRA